MIADKVKPETKLHQFLIERGSNKRSIQFDSNIWEEALNKLSDLNRPEYYLDFEDRLIEEIVVAMLKLPPHKAKEKILKIKDIIEEDVELDSHVVPYLQSLRTSIRGAAQTALHSMS